MSGNDAGGTDDTGTDAADRAADEADAAADEADAPSEETEGGTDEVEWAWGDDAGATSEGGVDVPEEPDIDAPLEEGEGAEDPLGDLARDIGAEPEGDDPFADAFEEVDLDEVESDQLWADLEADDISETVEEPRTEAERDVRVIEKRSYCQRCQYFSEPPDTACTHEGSDILEVVDTQQFRVADCPIVRGEEELQGR